MRSSAHAVIIGGGVVGASVLYHLGKRGWKDLVLVERDVLTSGSTWHAAGGFHTLNGDPNVAKLQEYTINLYREIEEQSGQATGVHVSGGVMLVSNRERWDWLKMAHARNRYLGVETRTHFGEGSEETFPAAGREPVHRRHVASPGGSSRSFRHHSCLCQGGANERRRSDPEVPRHRHPPAARRSRGTS